MPTINNTRSNGNMMVSELVDSVGTTGRTFTFPDTNTRDTLEVFNIGDKDLVVSVGTQSNVTINAFKSQKFSESFTSFTIRSTSGHASFRARASYPCQDEVDEDRLAAQLVQIAKYTNVDSFGAKGDGTTDDTTAIQNAINSVKSTGGVVQFTHGKTYKITSALVIYNNTTISAYGSTIKLMANEQHFIVNECFLDTSIRTRNTNINIFGGTFDASTFSGTNANNLRCIFWHVDNLTIRDAQLLSTSGKYMIALADTTNVLIDNLDFNSYSDGIHLLGKNYDTTITNISGTCGDDMVAVTTQDYVAYAFDEGEVNDLKIENVTGTNTTRIVLLGNTKYTIKNVSMKNIHQKGTGDVISIGDSGVSDATILVDNVYINNAYADDPTKSILFKHRHLGTIKVENVSCQIYFGRENSGVGEIDNFIAKNCSGYIWADSVVTRMSNVVLENIFNRVWLSYADKVTIRNMVFTYASQLLYLNGNSSKVTLEGCTLQSTNTGDDPIITYAGIINDIAFNNCKFTGGGTGQCIVLDGRSFGTAFYCTRITFSNCDIGNVKLLYRSAYNGTDINTEMNLSNVIVSSTNRLIENLANYNLTFKYINLTITSALNELFRFTTGKKLSVYGTGMNWGGAQSSVVGTISVDCFSLDFPAPVNLLNKVPKGKCYNTNAAISCGVGHVMSDGTSWKNLFSGATY